MNSIYFLFLLLLNSTFGQTNPSEKKVSIVILGTIQDAGAPQIGCEKDCCKDLFAHPDNKRQVVSLGLIDSENKKTYLFLKAIENGTPEVRAELIQLFQNSVIQPENKVSKALDLLNNTKNFEKMSKLHNPYGDGLASKRIVDFIKNRQ